MSRLKKLLRVAPPSTRNTQHILLRCCTPVAQHMHTTQQRDNDATLAGDWREFESLLAIFAPAYNTSAHEIDELRQLARDNIDDALSCYRIMAKQVRSKA